MNFDKTSLSLLAPPNEHMINVNKEQNTTARARSQSTFCENQVALVKSETRAQAKYLSVQMLAVLQQLST